MTRSFEIVERKLFESDFFLEKLRTTDFIFDANCYFSAFLSSSRSVTFALQASLSDLPGFDAWYREEQAALKNNPTAVWFTQARNASQKEGRDFINAGRFEKHGALFFHRPEPRRTYVEFVAAMITEAFTTDPSHPSDEEDICSKSERYLRDLVAVVQRCFERFGMDIDPQQYYTHENLTAANT